MDQTLVTSGYDIEIALSERYLQYLLLLAVDVGIIPVEYKYHGEDARLIVPKDASRTYELNGDAPLPEESPNSGFSVRIVFADVFKADLVVNASLHVQNEPAGVDYNLPLSMHIRLGLEKTYDAGALATAGLTIELTHVDGLGEPELSALKAVVNRRLSLDNLGTGRRIQDIAMRKFPPLDDGVVPAALVVYVNLLLLKSPASDDYLPNRGATSAGHNILFGESDLVFATRKDIYGAIAADAKFKRSRWSGSEYTFPLRFEHSDGTHRDGTLLSVGVEPVPAQPTVGGVDILRTRIKAEIQVDYLPDPDVLLLVDVSSTVDHEGVMSWYTSVDGHVSSFFYEFILPGLLVVFAPSLGLEVLLGLAASNVISGYIAEDVAGPIAERRVNAALLDIAPNRLTIVRRRWDPFYETQHQIGLSPGGSQITTAGIAFWGRAVLTRSTQVVEHVVIRDAEHVGNAVPTALRYRVRDIDPFRPFLEEKATAPATERRTFAEYIDPLGEANLFQLTSSEAIGRMSEKRLLRKQPYVVLHWEIDHAIRHWTVISQREYDEQSELLLQTHRNGVAPQIRADNEANVRQQVVDEFDAAGMVVTQIEIDAEVERRLQAMIDDDARAYRAGTEYPAQLSQALLPLRRLRLLDTQFYALEILNLLTVKGHELSS